MDVQLFQENDIRLIAYQDIISYIGGEVDMRKKSHISLAWYLMNSEGMDALKLHKGSFYIGSVLPDCMPSFLVRRHTIEDSFEVLECEFQKLVSHFDPEKGINCYFCRHLGMITHVHSPEAVRRREKMEMHTPADILAMIRQMHNRYLQMESVVKRDCQYIIELCHKVVDAVLCFLESLSAAKVSVAM